MLTYKNCNLRVAAGFDRIIPLFVRCLAPINHSVSQFTESIIPVSGCSHARKRLSFSMRYDRPVQSCSVPVKTTVTCYVFVTSRIPSTLYKKLMNHFGSLR